MIKIPKSHRISFNQIQHTQMYVCENEIENENENENISVHSAKIAKQSITWNKFHTVLFSYCFVKKKSTITNSTYKLLPINLIYMYFTMLVTAPNLFGLF